MWKSKRLFMSQTIDGVIDWSNNYEKARMKQS